MVRRNGQERHRHPEPRASQHSRPPAHLRRAWSLRRVLQRPGRQRKQQCEEQMRVIADECFKALLTLVLQRAVRSGRWRAESELERELHRRMRSDGLETVNVRTSRGTTVPVATPYYREKHARRAKRRPGLYPAWSVPRHLPAVHVEAGLRCKPREHAKLSSLAEAHAQLRSDGIAQDMSARPSIATLRGPERPSRARRASAGPMTAAERLPRPGPRTCESQDAWPPRRPGARPIPYRLGNRSSSSCTPWKPRRGDSTSSTWAAIDRRHAPGTGGGLRPAVVVLASTPLIEGPSSPTARPGIWSTRPERLGVDRRAVTLRRHRCWG